MAEKLILNAALNRKADFYAPEKCVVEKVVELHETAFKKLIEKPLEDQYFIKQYRELMGVECGMHHCILAIDSNSGDGNPRAATTLVTPSISPMQRILFGNTNRALRLTI